MECPKGKPQHIPLTYAAVKVAGDAASNSVQKLMHKGDIIPRQVQEDLHSKMKVAIKDLDLKGTFYF